MGYTIGLLASSVFRLGPQLLPLGTRLKAAMSAAFACPSKVRLPEPVRRAFTRTMCTSLCWYAKRCGMPTSLDVPASQSISLNPTTLFSYFRS